MGTTRGLRGKGDRTSGERGRAGHGRDRGSRSRAGSRPDAAAGDYSRSADLPLPRPRRQGRFTPVGLQAGQRVVGLAQQ